MNSPHIDYRVKVYTKQHDEKVILGTDGRLSVYTKMPPENGLANLDIVRLIAIYLDADKKKVVIVKGHAEPNKTVRIYQR